MTRFSITLQHGVEFVISSIKRMWGGEIFSMKTILPYIRFDQAVEIKL